MARLLPGGSSTLRGRGEKVETLGGFLKRKREGGLSLLSPEVQGEKKHYSGRRRLCRRVVVFSFSTQRAAGDQRGLLPRGLLTRGERFRGKRMTLH